MKLSLPKETEALLVAIAVILAGFGIAEVSVLLHFTVGEFLGIAVAFLGLIMIGAKGSALRSHKRLTSQDENAEDDPYTGD